MPKHNPKRTSAKLSKSAPKASPAPVKVAAAVPLPPSSEEPSPEGSDEEDSEEDDDLSEVITESDMKRLMDALGEEGVEEAMQMMAGGSDEEDDEEEQDEEDESEGEDAEEEVGEDAEMEGEDDIEEREDESKVPQQKVAVYNKTAMVVLNKRIHAPYVGMGWEELMTVHSPEVIEGSVEAGDDLQREVAFYKQALAAAEQARSLCAKNGVPFSRPTDFYAEMVKSDSHMERIRQKMLDETSQIKKSDDARRQRDLKKFGKKVQVSKLQERETERKAMDERLKGLKRKRKDDSTLQATGGDDDFDVKVEDAIARPAKAARGGAAGSSRGGRGDNKMSRRGRDAKFGFGGAGRHAKSNTKESTEDMDGFRGGGGRGGRGGGGGRGGRGGGRGGGASRGGAARAGKSKRQGSRRN